MPRVIISHDVDHLSVVEHYKDLVIPKFMGLSVLELKRKKISYKMFFRRIKDIILNRWNNIDSLINYDKDRNVNSTFFFGMANALGLSYSPNDAAPYIKKVIQAGLHAGVHGIETNNFEEMKREMERFREISGLLKVGVRMHYLRVNDDVLSKLEKIGYAYDSSIYSEELLQPYKIGNLYEIPLHIMDTYLFGIYFKNLSLSQAIEFTESLFKKINGTDAVINILFHQRHFSDSFKWYKEWYMWLIDYCIDKNYTFSSYYDLIKE